jgi:hypothetical protein
MFSARQQTLTGAMNLYASDEPVNLHVNGVAGVTTRLHGKSYFEFILLLTHTALSPHGLGAGTKPPVKLHGQFYAFWAGHMEKLSSL